MTKPPHPEQGAKRRVEGRPSLFADLLVGAGIIWLAVAGYVLLAALAVVGLVAGGLWLLGRLL